MTRELEFFILVTFDKGVVILVWFLVHDTPFVVDGKVLRFNHRELFFELVGRHCSRVLKFAQPVIGEAAETITKHFA